MKIRVLTRPNEMKIARRPRYATSILSQDECKVFNRTISYVNVVVQGIESLVGLPFDRAKRVLLNLDDKLMLGKKRSCRFKQISNLQIVIVTTSTAIF